MLGWYFSSPNKKLANGDGRRIRIGTTHRVEGKPVLCQHGLHASRHVLDALIYATSNNLYQVKLSGDIVHGDDKLCATERTYLAHLDAEPHLRTFSRECALDIIHLWDAPAIVREFLETGDESKKAAAWAAARAAAWAAARAAAGDAAWDAARAAAWAAARAAAWDAARAAAGDAARAAAWDAAWAAAWAAARAAAWDAARAAARAAAWEKYQRRLERMIKQAMR